MTGTIGIWKVGVPQLRTLRRGKTVAVAVVALVAVAVAVVVVVVGVVV